MTHMVYLQKGRVTSWCSTDGPRRVWFQNLGSACGDDRQWIEVPGKSVIQAAWEIGLLFEPLPVIGRWCTGNNYTRMFYVVLGKYMENIWVRTQWRILTIKYNNLHPASVGKKTSWTRWTLSEAAKYVAIASNMRCIHQSRVVYHPVPRDTIILHQIFIIKCSP